MQIPENLLFQIQPIRWIETPSFSFVFLGILFGCFLSFIVYIFSQRKNTNLQNTPFQRFSFPSLDDPYFEVKVASLFRGKLGSKYLQKHAFSHTSKDMRKYISDSSIIADIYTLELSEYSRKSLPPCERKKLKENYFKI